jgi:hypothetical protein
MRDIWQIFQKFPAWRCHLHNWTSLMCGIRLTMPWLCVLTWCCLWTEKECDFPKYRCEDGDQVPCFIGRRPHKCQTVKENLRRSMSHFVKPLNGGWEDIENAPCMHQYAICQQLPLMHILSMCMQYSKTHVAFHIQSTLD